MKVLGVRSGGRTADPHGEVTRPPRVRATTLLLDSRPAALDFVSPHERAVGKQTALTAAAAAAIAAAPSSAQRHCCARCAGRHGVSGGRGGVGGVQVQACTCVSKPSQKSPCYSHTLTCVDTHMRATIACMHASTLSRQACEHTRAGTQACKHARHSHMVTLSSARLALPPSVRACV